MKIKHLLESPDTIEAKHPTKGRLELSWREDDAIPFGYYNDKFLFDGQGGTHYELGASYNLRIGRSDMNNHGRIWLDHKIISFWDYPKNIFRLKGVVRDLEEGLSEYKFESSDAKIWDNGWFIEIIDKEKMRSYTDSGSSVLIPLEEYEGPNTSDYKHSDEDKDHNISPLLKKKKKVPYDKHDKLKMEPAKWDFYKKKNVAELKTLIREIIREELK